MKIVLFKEYSSKSAEMYNYDDYTNVWHNFNAFEDVREVTEEELIVLKSALKYFNSNSCKNKYVLKILEIVEDKEFNEIISNFRDYEKKEALRRDKLIADNLEADLVRKAKLEATKRKKLVKKLAKDFKLSEEEVIVMLDKAK